MIPWDVSIPPRPALSTKKLHMKSHLLFNALALVALGFTATLIASSTGQAQGKEENVPDGPWISSVVWQSESELLGTHSQGLLFRPAEVVRAASGAPQELTAVGHSDTSLWSVCALDDGRVVASDYRGGVWLFDAAAPVTAEGAAAEKAGSELANSPTGKPFELDARWIRALKKTPDADQLLAGTEDGKLLLLSVGQAKEIRRIDAHPAAIFDIAFSAAGDKVATAAGDGAIKIFSWPQLEPLASMSADKDATIWSLLFVNDDKQIVSGGSNNAIQLWDVASAQSIVTIAAAGNWVTSLAAIPDSPLVVAGCMDGKLVVVDWQTLQAVHNQDGPGSAIWSIALAPGGQQLAIATRKHGLAVVDGIESWVAAGQAAADAVKAVRPPAPPRE